MSLTKLTKRLRREARANPKKAVFLGMLVAAAMYFWAPVVAGWVPPEPAPADSPRPPLTTDLQPPVAANLGPARQSLPPSTEDRSYPWTQLDQWMRQDPATNSDEDLTLRRDPFALKRATVDPAGQKQSQADRPKVTPQSLKLTLTSTVVGPRGRVALIAGRAYREGETVKVEQGGQAIEFKLVEVDRRRVLLEREGKRFELTIPEPKGSDRIELTRHRG